MGSVLAGCRFAVLQSIALILSVVLLSPSYAAEPTRNLAVQKNTVERVALVIGNGAYTSAPLRNPPNDARDMGSTLRGLGFEVIEKIDVTQKEMNRAIVQFGQKLNASTMALFFYAGHGMQVKGKNYLLPVDAQISSEASVRAEAVDVDVVLDQFSVSRLNVVILDACRNNPFERRFRSMGGGLTQMDAPKGTLIAYATAPGKVASDGDGKNGIYTQELIKLIQMPGLPVETVFKRVRANVTRITGDNQIPWEASSLTGEFYFNAGTAGSAGEMASADQAAMPYRPLSPDPAAIELTYWESIMDSKDVADFNAYLAKYPEGQFASLARNRIATVGQTARTETAPDIAGLWHWSVKSIFVPDRVNTIKNDGTCMLSDGTSCVWRYHDGEARKVDFHFNDTWTHNMTLSDDGRLMKGTDDWGTAVVGTKAGMK